MNMKQIKKADVTAFALRRWDKGDSRIQVVEAVAAEYGITITPNAVSGMVHRAGKARSRGRGSRPCRRDASAATPQRQVAPTPPPPSAEASQPIAATQPVLVSISEPAAERAADVRGARMIGLLDLEAGDCRWPIGDPRHSGFGFCGQPRRPGRPYCAAHAECARPQRNVDEEKAA